MCGSLFTLGGDLRPERLLLAYSMGETHAAIPQPRSSAASRVAPPARATGQETEVVTGRQNVGHSEANTERGGQ